MGSLDNLYSAGIAEPREHDGEVPTITPAHAIAAVSTTDKLGRMLHREVMQHGRVAFQRFWQRYYNGWLAYKTLQADRLARSDPARVVETDLPNFVRGFYGWRDALARERGTVPGGMPLAPQPGPQQGQQSGLSAARPLIVLGGAIVAGILVRMWWQKKQKAREEEINRAMEAERAKVVALASGATAAPPSGLPMPSFPSVPVYQTFYGPAAPVPQQASAPQMRADDYYEGDE